MAKRIKSILIALICIVLMADIYGIWKYKLKGSLYESVAAAPVDIIIPESTDEEFFGQNSIEYIELSSENLSQKEKLYILNTLGGDYQGCYKIYGLVYEEYTITDQEYNSLKNGNSSIDICGIEYTSDKMKSSNLMLTSNEDTESLYVKYDSSIRAYVVKDATTDYSVYVPTEKYVTTTVSLDFPFVVEKNNKKRETVISEVAETHIKCNIPENKIKVNLCTLEFNSNDELNKITELNW